MTATDDAFGSAPRRADVSGGTRSRRRRPPLLLVVNPRATGVTEERTRLSAGVLEVGYEVTLAETRALGDGTDLARAGSRDGYALVAVLGGDGTVNEAANGLAGTGTPLGCLPAGRTNVFARTLGMPAEPVEAAARLLVLAGRPRVRRVDLGVMNDRHFTFASGVGLSASLNRRVDRRPALKSSLGPLYLAYSALSVLRSGYLGTAPHLRVSVGDQVAEGVTVVAQNSDPLTYLGPRAIRVCGAAGLQTGTLSLAMLRGSLRREVAPVVARLVSGDPARVLADRRVRGFERIHRAHVEPLDGRPLPVEVDGEYVGELDRIDYGVAPASLAVAA